MPLNVPNLLTWLRIVSIPLVVVLFYLPFHWSDPAAGALFAIAGITDTLDGSKTKRYRHAAGHLSECQSCATVVGEFGRFPNHGQFHAALKQKHGRKYGFWELVEG